MNRSSINHGSADGFTALYFVEFILTLQPLKQPAIQVCLLFVHFLVLKVLHFFDLHLTFLDHVLDLVVCFDVEPHHFALEFFIEAFGSFAVVRRGDNFSKNVDLENVEDTGPGEHGGHFLLQVPGLDGVVVNIVVDSHLYLRNSYSIEIVEVLNIVDIQIFLYFYLLLHDDVGVVLRDLRHSQISSISI